MPHTEVDLILCNGASVDFSHPLQTGDRVAVYPVFESFDVSPLLQVRPAPLREPRFVCDVHLGKLARRLRLLGFDTAYHRNYTDPEIVVVATREKRIVLTRDRGLLQHRAITRGTCVRSKVPDEQLAEVVRRFQLEKHLALFSRCMACNGVVQAMAKEEVIDQLGPETKRIHREFRRCPACGRVYWRGSHCTRLLARLQTVLPGVVEGHAQ